MYFGFTSPLLKETSTFLPFLLTTAFTGWPGRPEKDKTPFSLFSLVAGRITLKKQKLMEARSRLKWNFCYPGTFFSKENITVPSNLECL